MMSLEDCYRHPLWSRFEEWMYAKTFWKRHWLWCEAESYWRPYWRCFLAGAVAGGSLRDAGVKRESGNDGTGLSGSGA